jgi:hypothetical protein
MTRAQQLTDNEVADVVLSRFMSKSIDAKMLREVKAFATERLRYEMKRVGFSEDVARRFVVRVARPNSKMLMLRADRSDRL